MTDYEETDEQEASRAIGDWHSHIAQTQAEGRAMVAAQRSLSPADLIAKAIAAGTPVEALERLLAMRAELKREQARAAFFEGLSAFQAEIPNINKSKTANVQSARGGYAYRYADIADIQRAIAPTMHRNGLSVTFDTKHTEGGYLITCIVHHVEGHSERTEFLVPIDAQARMNDAQKAGSALTYGRRYALCAALGIVTAEDDDDGQAMNAPSQRREYVEKPVEYKAPQVISDTQHKHLESLLAESGLPRERVRAWLASKYSDSYPEGLHFNKLLVPHFEDLVRNIPRFVASMNKEAGQ